MKKTLLSLLALVAATGAVAQSSPDQMSIRIAGYEVTLNGKNTCSDTPGYWTPEGSPNWRGANRNGYIGRIGLIEVGQPFLRTYGDSYAAYPASENGFMDLGVRRSDYIAINLTTFSTALTRNQWIGVTMALGFAYNGYSLDRPVALAKVDRMLHPVATEQSLKKSKIRSWWIHVPLEVEINPARNFFISAGGYMDLMFWSGAKWKSPKQKFADPYINPMQMGLRASVGFRDVYFFGKYSISEFFQKDKGPRLNQYTIGVGFGF